MRENFNDFTSCREKTLDVVNLYEESLKKNPQIDPRREIQNCLELVPLAKEYAKNLENSNKVLKAIDVSEQRLKVSQEVIKSFSKKIEKNSRFDFDKNFSNLILSSSFVEQHETMEWAKIQIKEQSIKNNFDSLSFFNFFSILFIGYLFYSMVFKKKEKKP